MKICLVNPPLMGKRGEGSEYEPSFYTFPHIGVGYIAAVLEKNGYEVDIVECPSQDISTREFVKKAESEKYDVIGISTYYYNFKNVVKMVESIKSKLPSAFVFSGGYLATLSPEHVFHYCEKLDCCVIGEGEITCLELMNAIRDKKDLKNIEGIVFKSESEIVHTPHRKYIENLDVLPIPKRVFISEKLKVATLQTSRGCYGKCIFCSQKEYYEKVLCSTIRYRGVENVVEEIEYLSKERGINKLYLLDDTFFGSSPMRREWLNEFYRLMQKKGLKLSFFRISARANEVIRNRDLLEKLKEIGLTNVFVGIESFVQRQLDFYDKATTVEQNTQAIRILKEVGINLEFGFLPLDPFATIEEVNENYTRLKSTKYFDGYRGFPLFSCNFPSRIIAVPGTKLNSILEEKGLLVENSFFYEFQDSKVNLFYEITKLWERKIADYLILLYSVLKAEYYDAREVMESLQDEDRKLMKLDIDFVLELCREIMNGNIANCDDAACSGMLDRWAEQVKPVFDKFVAAKDVLDQYS